MTNEDLEAGLSQHCPDTCAIQIDAISIDRFGWNVSLSMHPPPFLVLLLSRTGALGFHVSLCRQWDVMGWNLGQSHATTDDILQSAADFMCCYSSSFESLFEHTVESNFETLLVAREPSSVPSCSWVDETPFIPMQVVHEGNWISTERMAMSSRKG